MMNPLKKYRQRKEQDRIALGIAERHGMRQQYLEARKHGLSPLEALEDWDLIRPEERELFINA